MNWNSFKIICYSLFCLIITSTPSVVAQITKPTVSSRNDHIFPPSKEASVFVNYDQRGFIIHGKRTFIVSAGIEYARVPRELWRDRLTRLKRGGYNAVEVYTFWNFHEPREGQFNFSGERDLNAFLKLVNELEMFAIVRVGPYYCGEWNFGGYPIWLKFKPGLVARKDNKEFLDATDRFFEKLIPIVSQNQIHRGGSVIMVQLENEHPESWGTVIPNNYFSHLINKSVSLGLQVPYFISGLHPGNDPASNIQNLDDPKRPNPWFSTEFWGVWFFNYGPQPQDSTIYDRRTWKIIAHGGKGYNVYMAHGGSNFEYNNDRDMAASYDYGAGVGQAGDLRPIYFSYKRAAWFARSFQEILANSTDGGQDFQWVTRDTSVKVNARTSPAGDVVFLDNADKIAKSTLIRPPKDLMGASAISVSIAAGEIMPIIQNFKITRNIKLEWAPSRIYGIFPQAKTTTLVSYGEPGSPVNLYFDLLDPVKILTGNSNFTSKHRKLQFSALVENRVKEFAFETGGRRLRILLMPGTMTKHLWFVKGKLSNYIITGPSYVDQIRESANKIKVLTEKPWITKGTITATIYKEKGSSPLLANTEKHDRKVSLSLAPWRVKSATEAASPQYDDTNWKTSPDPLQMGADGDFTANAWYRTTIQVDTSGMYTLRFKSIKERATLFVNGLKQNAVLKDKSFTFPLEADKANAISIFTAHDGRNKQLFYLGGLDTIDMKGISGAVTLERHGSKNPGLNVSGWKMRGGPGDYNSSDLWTDVGAANYSGPAFFKTSFTLPDTQQGQTTIWRVNITTMGHGSVWVNGHNLGRYPEKIKIFGLYIPECWLKPGSNSLIIYDEDGINPRQIAIQAEIEASRDLLLLAEK